MTIETLPEVAPFEPTTPIKPSEAIRLGCLIAPVATRSLLFGADGSACALGAMALGLGYEPGDYVYGPLGRLLPPKLPYPGGGPIELISDATDAIYMLNDWDDWSRERIAAWLEGLGL